jgi:hypothetical protein
MWYPERGPSPHVKSHPGAGMQSPKTYRGLWSLLHTTALRSTYGHREAFWDNAEMTWPTAEQIGRESVVSQGSTADLDL